MLFGSNDLKVVSVRSRYGTASHLGGCFFVTTGGCKSKFNPVAAGSSKANTFKAAALSYLQKDFSNRFKEELRRSLNSDPTGFIYIVMLLT